MSHVFPAATLESALVNIGREDIIRQCIYTEDQPADPSSRLQGGYPGSTVTTFRTTEFIQVINGAVMSKSNFRIDH